MTRQDAYESFREVHDHLRAAKFSVAYILRGLGDNSLQLHGSGESLRPRNFRDCGAGLELTYSVKLFAVFEGVIRSYWQALHPGRRRRTQMEVVMNRIASRCAMRHDVLADAHQVREYRNEAMHAGQGRAVLTFEDCKSRLNTFVSHLPRGW